MVRAVLLDPERARIKIPFRDRSCVRIDRWPSVFVGNPLLAPLVDFIERRTEFSILRRQRIVNGDRTPLIDSVVDVSNAVHTYLGTGN
ncbi:hypothetical protein EL22_08385 [Halostagnicola sp. A56]|nr:hypothetical protein EL22_08385 [Halostagnicola sp. A56]